MTEKSKTETCVRCNTPPTNKTEDVVLDSDHMAWRVYQCNCGFLKIKKIEKDEEGRAYIHD